MMKRSWFLKRKLLTVGTAIAALFLLASCAIVYTAQGEKEVSLVVSERPRLIPAKSKINNELIRVMTLNIAHGRGDGFSQVFQKVSTIESTLNDISSVVRRESPDIFALQEVDSFAVWSGYIDEANHIAHLANYPFTTHGNHVKWYKLAYGTSLLSKFKLHDPRSVTFAPSPPTFTKGFVISTVIFPGQDNYKVDVVSVHLDFSRKSVRLEQIAQMINYLSTGNNPLIVMGDFNCEWDDKKSALRVLANRMGLSAYQPQNKSMKTFKKLNKRLDWILISSHFNFQSCSILPDVVSDHFGVVCDLVYTDGSIGQRI